MTGLRERGVVAAGLLALLALSPACGRKGSLEKAGRKADEAIEKAGEAAKEAADRLKATATAAGADAADRAGRAGQAASEGARKVGDDVKQTAGNVASEVQKPRPTPPPGSSPAGARRKPEKY